MKIRSEIKVGVLIIISAGLAIWGIFFLKGTDLLQINQHRQFHAIYPKVESLTTNNNVQINGMNVGQVNDIKFHPDNSGRLIVTITMHEEYPVPASSIARIVSLDLLGTKAIALELGEPQTGDSLFARDTMIYCKQGWKYFPLLPRRPQHTVNDGDLLLVQGNQWYYIHTEKGELLSVDTVTDYAGNRKRVENYEMIIDTLPLGLRAQQVLINDGDTMLAAIQATLEEEVNAQIRPLKAKTEELIGEIDSAVVIVQTLINEEVSGNVKESFNDIREAIQTFRNTSLRVDTMIIESRYRLNSILGNIQVISKTLKDNNAQLENVINNLSTVSDSLAAANVTETINNASMVMKEVSGILEKVNNGEGSLGLLIHDDKLYNELTIAAADLNLLMLDIRTNPGKYMPLKRNKKPKELERDSTFYNNMLKIDSTLIRDRE